MNIQGVYCNHAPMAHFQAVRDKYMIPDWKQQLVIEIVIFYVVSVNKYDCKPVRLISLPCCSCNWKYSYTGDL